MNGPTPLLDLFKRGEVAREVRLLAAEGTLAPRGQEQLGILVLLLEDPDADVRRAAEQTLSLIPADALATFLARPDVPAGLREFFAKRGVLPSTAPGADEEDAPLIANAGEPESGVQEDERTDTALQRLQRMTFTERLKAAMKGTREMRAILVRDTNKMIAAAVLSSPKLNDQEVESYARMANVSEDVLRTIGSNRAWTKNYGVVIALTKNPKTPLALSLNLMSRLNDRDLAMLSVDRNVPEPLRVAARKKAVSSTSRR